MLAAFHGLLGISKNPQSKRAVAKAAHAGILAANKRQSAMGIAIVKGDAPFQVLSGSRYFPEKEKTASRSPVCKELHAGVGLVLAQPQQIVAERPRDLVIPSNQVESPQPEEHGEEPGVITATLRKCARAIVGAFNLGGMPT